MLIDFYSTLGINFINGFNVGLVSLNYPIEISPSTDTFQIWALIYVLLFGYAWSSPPKEEVELFRESMQLNRSWIISFTDQRFSVAYDTLKRLSQVNRRLANLNNRPEQQFGLDLYSQWTEIAALLNKGIYNKYIQGVDDSVTSLAHYLDHINTATLRAGQKYALRCGATGILNNLKMSKYEPLRQQLKLLLENF